MRRESSTAYVAGAFFFETVRDSSAGFCCHWRFDLFANSLKNTGRNFDYRGSRGHGHLMHQFGAIEQVNFWPVFIAVVFSLDESTGAES